MDKEHLLTGLIALILNNYLYKDSLTISKEDWDEFVDGDVEGIEISKESECFKIILHKIDSDALKVSKEELIKALKDSKEELMKNLNGLVNDLNSMLEDQED